jgi:hypothetical protein
MFFLIILSNACADSESSIFDHLYGAKNVVKFAFNILLAHVDD